MTSPLQLSLTPEQHLTLEQMRDHHPHPYAREHAAALLKVASGLSCAKVARTGLFKPRRPETVGKWVHRYQQGGIAALLVRQGRGRKPAFSP